VNQDDNSVKSKEKIQEASEVLVPSAENVELEETILEEETNSEEVNP